MTSDSEDFLKMKKAIIIKQRDKFDYVKIKDFSVKTHYQ